MARAALVEGLRREVADARARFEEATLRAEAHRLLGDDAGAAEVVREQEQILAEVQGRLARVVSASVVERDAEQVLADVSGSAPPPAATTDAVAAVDDDPAPARRPALAGVASMVAVLAVATAAVLGLTRSLDQVEVTEAAADVTPTPTASAEPTPTDRAAEDRRTPVATGHPGGAASDAATVPPAPDASTTTDDPAPAATSEPDVDATPTPSPTPEPASGLGAVVEGLVDAVGRLGPDDDPDDDADDGLADEDPTDEDTPGDGVTGGGATEGEDLDTAGPGLDDLLDTLRP